MLTRRNAILLSVAGAICLPKTSAAGEAGFGHQQYDRAMIIDGLCGAGGFDPSAADDAPLSPKFIADVQASGVTAVNVTVNEPGSGPNRFENAVVDIADMEHEITAHPDVFIKVLRAKDLTEAKATHRMGLIFGFQDGNMIEGDLTRLSTFYDLGVRISQPTYNRRNLLGDGCLETSDGGLSRFGHEFIAEMNRLSMLLDLSHAGPRTISEGIAASAAPMAITTLAAGHWSTCREILLTPRSERSPSAAVWLGFISCRSSEPPDNRMPRI